MGFRNSSRFLILAAAWVLVVSLMLNFTACDARERIIKIGNQTVLSGEYEYFGLDQTISASLAVSELSPIEIGGFSYQIELVTRDDEGNPERAFLAAQELVEQDVSAVVGSAFNGTTRVSVPVYQEYNIPILSPSAHGEELSTVGNNFFRMVINNQQRVDNIATFLIGKNPQDLVVIDNRSEYALHLTDYLIEALSQQEIEVDRRYSMDFAEEGYEILIENLVLDGPDLIFACLEYDQLANVIKNAREAGIDALFVTEELGKNDQIGVLAGETELEGLLAVIADPPSIARYTENDRAVDFWRKYTAHAEKMGMEEDMGPGKYAPYTYDAVHMIVQAMRSANSVNPGEILRELREISYEGVAGTLAFDSNGDRLEPASTVFVFTNGAWTRY